jgi:hypothetical protein
MIERQKDIKNETSILQISRSGASCRVRRKLSVGNFEIK